MKTYGGRINYGEAIGIIMGETLLPRIPGDVGNATSFSFPVRFKKVEGALFSKIRVADQNLVQPYIKAAQELEKEGVRAVATSCGFMAAFHKELVSSVHIPMFSSSLLQVHLASRIINPNQKIGVITASADSLGQKQFEGIGIQDIPMVVYGMDEIEEFCYTIYEHHADMDVSIVEKGVVNIAKKMVQEHPDIGAIVIECTNLSPYSKKIQDAVHLPIFDIISLINFAYSVVVKKSYNGFM